MTTRRSFIRRALGGVLAAVATVYCPGLGEDDGEWVDCREFTSVEFNGISVHGLVNLRDLMFANYKPIVTVQEFVDGQSSGLFTPTPSAEQS